MNMYEWIRLCYHRKSIGIVLYIRAHLKSVIHIVNKNRRKKTEILFVFYLIFINIYINKYLTLELMLCNMSLYFDYFHV